MKRAFDIVVSFAGLIVVLPVMALVGLLIKIDSPGPVLFKQERVGKGFRPFLIYKFRTMAHHAGTRGPSITFGRDPRITRVGCFLRKSKIDELPQLLNVLKGDMTFVGPRPEVPQYVELFRKDYAEILTMRPGITDLASLKYRDEATLLGTCNNPEQEYITRVLPDKISLGKQYIQHSSIAYDLKLISKTLLKLVHAGSEIR